MDERAYTMASAIPNKILNSDGSITDFQGNQVDSTSLAYKRALAIPNKVLMPDGSYSTLQEVIGGSVSGDIFIVVDVLPDTGEENKIYLVPAQNGMFNEYYWNENGKWDKLGTVDLSNCATKEEVNQALTDAKAYTDDAIENYVPMRSFDDYPTLVLDGTTDEFFQSVKDLNLPVGTLLLGSTQLTDVATDYDMRNEEMRVEVYPNGIIRGIMTSTNISPYEWTIQWGTEEGIWIPTVIQSGTDTQVINTNIEVGNGKSVSVTTEDGNTSSALSANQDGTISATVKIGDETTTEQVAYISDIDKKVTNVLGGEY